MDDFQNIDKQYLGMTGLAMLNLAFVAFIKATANPPKSLQPVIAMVSGILAGCLVAYMGHGNIANGMFMGMICGLSSMGIYSGTKSSIPMGLLTMPDIKAGAEAKASSVLDTPSKAIQPAKISVEPPTTPGIPTPYIPPLPTWKIE
jgi:hypothetical protein